MKSKFSAGGCEIEFDEASRQSMKWFEMSNDILSLIAPGLRDVLKRELLEIEQRARAEWPVREKGSKGSRDKIRTGVVIEQAGDRFIVRGFIDNTAQYAWAIKSSTKRKTSIKPGRRVANELLWKPVRKASRVRRVVAQMTDVLLKEEKKNG